MKAPKTRPPTPTDRSTSPTASRTTVPADHESGRVTAPAPETILLAVTGMSPAVLTETLWALAHPADDSPPVIPNRVIVITTTRGRDHLARLFEPSPQLGGVTPWDALRTALAARGHDLTGRLRFGLTGDDVRIITAAAPPTGLSRELPDIRDRADNEAAADFLLEQVRALVENPDTDLIVSVAGGRKTMSALLYACLTLVGRETDRLTHVLVSEPYETLRDFWFPAQPGGPIKAPTRSAGPVGSASSGPTLVPAAAVIQLADVPFVPLRNLFQRELGRKAGSFLRLIEHCRAGVRRRAAETLRVILDTTRAELEVNGLVIKLAPMEMLVALFLARRAKNNEPAYPAYKNALDDLNAFRQEQIAATKDFNNWRHADSLKTDLKDPETGERFLVKAISSLRDKLRQGGGDAATLAASFPEKGRCSLDLPGPMIFIK